MLVMLSPYQPFQSGIVGKLVYFPSHRCPVCKHHAFGQQHNLDGVKQCVCCVMT